MAYLVTAQAAMEAHTSKVGLFKALAKRKPSSKLRSSPPRHDEVENG